MTVDTQLLESEAMRFEPLKAVAKDGAAARLGRLAVAGRTPIDTPNFIAMTSRGTLPHITPENVSRHLQVTGTYMALEDFIERPQQNLKRIPPIYATPTTTKHTTRLHSFTAMPQSVTTVLSARRLPAVASPMGNTNASVSVFTSTGFQPLTTKDYLSAVQTLKPDVAIPPADLTNSPTTPNSKRALRMAERTDEWVVEWFSELPEDARISTFAPSSPSPTPCNGTAPPPPLAIDLSSPLTPPPSPLSTTANCTCYACTSHHRAYVRHLLAAREMLGWTLLQIHNHAVLSAFFAGVRETLARGGEEALEAEARQFNLLYESEFPEGVGEKPRARGYQYKSVGREEKRNKAAWGKLGSEGGRGGGS
ncbi:hypothetical protein N0V88_001085 [Collariella sp. IMI 366227]|nr:hypothetical protein N0V88_001085 [Collariella sp. IMI 366227]